MPKIQPGTNSSAPVDVFVAEASQLNCQLVERAFRPKRNRVHVVGSAVRGEEALAALQQTQPDVAVISAQLQDSAFGGYRVLRDLRTHSNRTRGVMLLHSRERELVVDAFRCGARGVVFRDQPVEILRKCIHAVHHGQIWASSEIMGVLVEALSETMPVRLRNARGAELLSKREADVVRLVVDGLNNRDIALQLALTEHTVRNYLFHVFEKLGVSSRVELVLYWFQQQSNGSSADAPAELSDTANA